jgi:murein L,D-transpeptidase YcbB/YkuD
MRIQIIASSIALAISLLAAATVPASAQTESSDELQAMRSALVPPGADDIGPTQARCTHLTIFPLSRGRHVNFPTIGTGTGATNCILSYGDHNWGVVALQQWLQFCGAPQVEVDGIYGPVTRDAITWAQATHGIKMDGVYGPQTRDILLKATFNNGNGFVDCITRA